MILSKALSKHPIDKISNIYWKILVAISPDALSLLYSGLSIWKYVLIHNKHTNLHSHLLRSKQTAKSVAKEAAG